MIIARLNKNMEKTAKSIRCNMVFFFKSHLIPQLDDVIKSKILRENDKKQHSLIDDEEN